MDTEGVAGMARQKHPPPPPPPPQVLMEASIGDAAGASEKVNTSMPHACRNFCQTMVSFTKEWIRKLAPDVQRDPGD